VRCDVCRNSDVPGMIRCSPADPYMPCPACLNGEVNCCDGEVCQPERVDVVWADEDEASGS
jgi:hypothetical protein